MRRPLSSAQLGGGSAVRRLGGSATSVRGSAICERISKPNASRIFFDSQTIYDLRSTLRTLCAAAAIAWPKCQMIRRSACSPANLLSPENEENESPHVRVESHSHRHYHLASDNCGRHEKCKYRIYISLQINGGDKWVWQI